MSLNILEVVQYTCIAILAVGVPVELWRRYKGPSPYEQAVQELEQKLKAKPEPEGESKSS
jgi:hypothetical protein